MITTLASSASLRKFQVLALIPLLSPALSWCAVAVSLERAFPYQPGSIELAACGAVLSHYSQPTLAAKLYKAALNLYPYYETDDAFSAEVNLRLARAMTQNQTNNDAKLFFERSIRANTNIYGAEHPRTIYSKIAYGEYLRTQGSSLEAISEVVGAGNTPDFAPVSWAVLHRASLVAFLYEDTEDTAKAASIRAQTITAARDWLGPDHIFVASEQIALAIKSPDQCLTADNELAAEILQNEIKGNRDQSGTLRHNLGAYYVSVKRYSSAVPLLEEALALKTRHSANNGNEAGATMFHLAEAYRGADRIPDALSTALKLLELDKKTLGSNHLETSRANQLIGELISSLGDEDAAMKYFVEAYRGRREAERYKYESLGAKAAPGSAWSSRGNCILRFPIPERAFDYDSAPQK